MTLHAVIMAGGSGTRFWPASRQTRPKQLLPLANGKSMVRAAIDRLAGACPPDRIWIVTNARQKKAIGKLLLDFPMDQILVEPEPRDTAPCVALATAKIASIDADATMIVLPADHIIEPVAEFQRMVERACAIAQDGETLVTFGVEPSFAATGFGYIELGEARDQLEPRAYAARSFREKPGRETAQRFVDDGGFRWNSGIFVFQVAAMRRAMAAHEPALATATDRMLTAFRSGRRAQVTNAFKRLPKTSIDFAVMEKADRMVVVECTARWHDVGSFPALASILTPDRHGNHLSLHKDASVTSLDSKDNVVYAEGKRTVALFGVEGLVIAAVGDAVLVCPQDRASDLKSLVEHLRAEGRSDLL